MSDGLSSYDHVMQQPLSPTTRRRRLGMELRKLRDAAGVAAETSAQELDCSVAKIRHIEGGRNAPSKSELKALVELYHGGRDVLDVLEEIRKEASKPGWWSTYRLPKWLQSYVGAETDAHTVRTFQLEAVPGLLQTPAYARFVHEEAEATDIDRKVRALGKRQERLIIEDRPLELAAIVSEGALRRVADHDFAAEQYRHLLELGKRPNVSIRVLPYSTGLHNSMSGGFILLEFEPEVSMPACYFEHSGGGQLVDDRGVVEETAAKFAKLHRKSMDEEESARFIAEWI